MAWQDRPYYRERGSGAGSPLMWLLSGSMPLFTAFGIRVRAHASMVILVVLTLVTAGADGGMGIRNAITFSTVLFGVILLHEFGHCFAARSVSGDARDILMWPLGGLAYADAPERWWPQFVTAVGGPLVNVAICLLTALFIGLLSWGVPHVAWNPLSSDFHPPYGSNFGYWLWFIFTISWGLLLFNLLPVFPMDGGRILQTLLWARIGYYKATMIACGVGMVGSVIMAVYGLANFGSWYGLVLIFIGVSCFLTCFSTRAALRAAGPWEFEHQDGIDYSASLFQTEKTKRSSFRSRRRARALQKRAKAERDEQRRIDAILEKVSQHGMHSLTWMEKRALKKATEHQRQRDLEGGRSRRI